MKATLTLRIDTSESRDKAVEELDRALAQLATLSGEPPQGYEPESAHENNPEHSQPAQPDWTQVPPQVERELRQKPNGEIWHDVDTNNAKQIIDALVDRFGVSVNDIARKTGMTSSGIYALRNEKIGASSTTIWRLRYAAAEFTGSVVPYAGRGRTYRNIARMACVLDGQKEIAEMLGTTTETLTAFMRTQTAVSKATIKRLKEAADNV